MWIRVFQCQGFSGVGQGSPVWLPGGRVADVEEAHTVQGVGGWAKGWCLCGQVTGDISSSDRYNLKWLALDFFPPSCRPGMNGKDRAH